MNRNDTQHIHVIRTELLRDNSLVRVIAHYKAEIAIWVFKIDGNWMDPIECTFNTTGGDVTTLPATHEMFPDPPQSVWVEAKERAQELITV